MDGIAPGTLARYTITPKLDGNADRQTNGALRRKTSALPPIRWVIGTYSTLYDV
jgi:hypothetical protein